jgi:hypothetical protein
MHDESLHVPLSEITPEHWVVYLGSVEVAQGWAHILFVHEQLDPPRYLLCAHNREFPGGTVLQGVRDRSIYVAGVAESVAKRMEFWDPRKETTDA